MKIAVITDDGKTISRHFGRARYYQIIEIKNGEVINREMREKFGHSEFAHREQRHYRSSEGSGMDSASHSKHTRMAETISDCSALICGGMGRGAYQSMETVGIKPLVTKIEDIDQAIEAYLQGNLKDHTEMLH
ncbi:MAG: NifB/NifX family molybdenum-iron cluster-binding protein [Chloroflexota bacterium]|nr:NifB/NifX family molybdenum-iron cluster-binding protein [Chloroflexota bacterium]